MQKIILQKTNERGSLQEWIAEINGATATISFGQVGGKYQTEVVTYTEGKNIGKKNETSAEEQCIFEVVRRARKKCEKEYTCKQGQELLKEHKGNTVIDVDTNAPMPMLATPYEKCIKTLEKYDSVWAQPKLDGNRLTVNLKTGRIYSRSRKEICSIPGLGAAVQKACKNLKGIEWIDGELYSHDLTFNEIQSIARSKEPHEKANLIGMNIFDFILPQTWEERRLNLQKIATNDRVQIVEDELIPATEDAIQRKNDEYVAQGYEGVIIRLPDYKYEFKRTKGLIKFKAFVDQEFKIVGFKSEVNNKTKLGSIILFDEETQKNFDATPAATDKEKDYMFTHQDEFIGKFATCKYQERDVVTGTPRFGTIKGLRAENDIEVGR